MKFKLFGTEIYISFIFSAMLAFMLATDRTGLIIPTVIAVIVHEAGHLFAMWISDCSPKAIRLIPTSVKIIRDFPKKSCNEAFIAICGPFANLSVFLSFYVGFINTKYDYLVKFAILNLVIAIFNLLPIKGLDGGTLLFILLSKIFGIVKSELILKFISVFLGITVFLFGIYAAINQNFNLSVFIIGIYLIISAIIKI